MKSLFLATLLALSPMAASAGDYMAGDLHITNPTMPMAKPGGRAAGGYMTITNNGDQMERLLDAESDFADRTMIHKTTVDSDGVARMRHQEFVEIPPGASVEFKRGGLHVMVMDLNDALGETLPATLIFERAGRVAIEFARTGDAMGMGHSQMDHGHMDHSKMKH